MEQERKEQIQEVYKRLDEINDLSEIENLVKNNTVEFNKDNVFYRIRQLNQLEVRELGEKTRKKYLDLINDETYLFKKNWIDIYKKKDIDIVALESKIKNLNSETEKLLLRLAISNEPKEIDTIKKEIEENKNEIYNLSVEVAGYLQYSIEEQIKIYGMAYQTYLMFEVKDGDNWKRAFDTFESFSESKDDIVVTATYYASYIIHGLQYEIRFDKKTR